MTPRSGDRRQHDSDRSWVWRVGAYLGLVEDPRSRPRRGSRAWWRRLGWIALGSALVLAPARAERTVGKVAAAFFTAIFPGNVEQFADGRDGFGLDSDRKRFARLFFQPVLVAWALWSTHGARR